MLGAAEGEVVGSLGALVGERLGDSVGAAVGRVTRLQDILQFTPPIIEAGSTSSSRVEVPTVCIQISKASQV